MNGNEEILALLEKMDARLGRMEAGQAKLEEGLAGLKSSVLRLELIEAPRIHAALDGLAAYEVRLNANETRLRRLEDMTERSRSEITALKKIQ